MYAFRLADDRQEFTCLTHRLYMIMYMVLPDLVYAVLIFVTYVLFTIKRKMWPAVRA